jgi:penicillin-binding protein 1B
MDLVRRQLRRDYREGELVGAGLRIYTTLDPWLQTQAEQVLARQLPRLEKSRGLHSPGLQGAVVVVNSDTGEVAALVGDKNPRYAGFNRALDAVRPVGSLIKPVVYLTALSRPDEYHLMSKLEDRPIRIQGANGQVWTPANYDHTSHGEVALQTALAKSYNQATVGLGMSLGLPAVLDRLWSLGISRPVDAYPSMLLGAVSISPLEMAQVYQTLASGGYLAQLKAIREVTDSRGRLLSRYPSAIKQVLDPRPVYLLNHALQEVVRTGTARSLSRLLPAGARVAGKTGTTDDLRDSWFAGFDRRHVAVVWIGRDDNESIGLTGSSGALQVWGELMGRVGVASLEQSPPAGVELVAIDPESGLRGAGCPHSRNVPFIEGSGPRREARCARHRSKGSMDDELNWLQRLFR